MGRLKARLHKLESACSPKRYVWCEANHGESAEEAVRRHARELGVQPEEIGYACVVTDGPLECIDFGGHAGVHSLQGYVSLEERLKMLAAEDSGA
jgi:hypothetical protein